MIVRVEFEECIPLDVFLEWVEVTSGPALHFHLGVDRLAAGLVRS